VKKAAATAARSLVHRSFTRVGRDRGRPSFSRATDARLKASRDVVELQDITLDEKRAG
jgi:hypothetical protein